MCFLSISQSATIPPILFFQFTTYLLNKLVCLFPKIFSHSETPLTWLFMAFVSFARVGSVLWLVCGGQRRTCEYWYLLSTLWVLGIEARFSGFVEKQLYPLNNLNNILPNLLGLAVLTFKYAITVPTEFLCSVA